ncbi:UDP-glucose pyrophosphorylase [Fasciola hepatica]|uniref:UTP--glucose-1-phosphate uridylyltransferase n=1 Tax=Fasciola hepatica TaxID=6192 RepID=A0A4E0RFV3_FASHE|nr:UDP-glucose pyrophosphorylase [Fasciola hepatica]
MTGVPTDTTFQFLSTKSSFREVPFSDGENNIRAALTELRSSMSDEERENYPIDEETFLRMYRAYLKKDDQVLHWSDITQPEDLIGQYETLAEPNHSEAVSLLNKLVVIKLNGGLGTSMGCTGPKSLIPVRDGKNFIDLTVEQITELNVEYGCDVPLVLMNSFNTNSETLQALNKSGENRPQIFTFEQNRFPRLSPETGLPLKSVGTFPVGSVLWYPPGHGDVYRSFEKSGLLEKFMKEGKTWVFISNIDNLGATVDTAILNYLENSHDQDHGCDFLMEVTPKTPSDIKGGTLVKFGRKLRLLELAQVPENYIEDFTSVRKFKFFNTNNLWVNLKAMAKLLVEKRISMELIVNPKTVNKSIPVLQLEEAAGAAIHNFDKPRGLTVPRSRFLPVKLTADLLLVMSNLYILEKGRIVPSPLRNFPTLPLVKLGKHFSNIKDFRERLKSIPDMLELDHLTVSGDVHFDKNVTLKGTVIIIARESEQIDIPVGAYLENKIITGNLRVLPH